MGEVDVLPPRQVVVSALPLRRKQFAVLAEQLGPQFRVVDIRDAPEHVDVVLCPPCSPQTIGRLRETFPTARVVALELNDPDSGLRIDGLSAVSFRAVPRATSSRRQRSRWRSTSPRRRRPRRSRRLGPQRSPVRRSTTSSSNRSRRSRHAAPGELHLFTCTVT